MAEEKKKEIIEETPALVEVYGDKKEKNKEKEVDDMKLKEEKMDKKPEAEITDDLEVEVKHLKPLREQIEETTPTEKPTTLKTEVIDGGEAVEEVDKNSIDHMLSVEEKNEKDEAAFDEEIGMQKKASQGVFGMGLVVFLAIFGLTGWGFYFKTKWVSSDTTAPVVEATPTPTTLPTPDPTPEPIVKEEVVMEVLNGSGISGLAGKKAAIFENLGYTIDRVGNGDSVTQTQVYVRESDEQALWEVLGVIEEELSVSSISGYLEDDSEILIQIILGE